MTTPDDKPDLGLAASTILQQQGHIASLEALVRELERAGYIVSMALLQSTIVVDDAERAARDMFLTPEITRAFLAAEHALRERAEKDAVRWNRLCELWAASTTLELRQTEDGRWAIVQIEAVESDCFAMLVGDEPDAAIDSALQSDERAGER